MGDQQRGTGTVAGGKPPMALEGLLGALRRRLALIALTTALAAAAAFAVSVTREREYTAAAQMLIRDPALDQKLFGTTYLSTETPERRSATTLRLANLAEVAERVARRPDIDLPASAVRAAVRVTADDSDVIQISATRPDLAESVAIANAYADEFKAFRRDADRAQMLQAAEVIRRQLDASATSGKNIDELRTRLQELQTLAAVQTGGVEIVQPALAPGGPSAPNPRRATVLGALFGAFIGVLLAALVEQLDRRTRTASEVVEALGHPHLASIPLVPAGHAGDWEGQHVDLRAAEAFKVLRETLRYARLGPYPSVILVVSATAAEGKTTVARGLAAAAASVGESVLLIDADFRGPGVLAGASPAATGGLAEALSEGRVKEVVVPDGLMPRRWDGRANYCLVTGEGDTVIERHTQRVPLPPGFGDGDATMDVLPSGRAPQNPVQLLKSTAMRTLVLDARARYELIVFDTAPLEAVADSLPLVQLSDAVVVVGRPGVTTRSAAKALGDRLDMVAAPVIGTVVNGAAGGDAPGDYRRAAVRPVPDPLEPREAAWRQ